MTPTTPDDLGFDPNQVTPGWEGFAVTALIGAAIIVLMLQFFRRVTRINNRAEARERIEAELAEREARQGTTADASSGTPSDGRPVAVAETADDDPKRA